MECRGRDGIHFLCGILPTDGTGTNRVTVVLLCTSQSSTLFRHFGSHLCSLIDEGSC